MVDTSIDKKWVLSALRRALSEIKNVREFHAEHGRTELTTNHAEKLIREVHDYLNDNLSE